MTYIFSEAHFIYGVSQNLTKEGNTEVYVLSMKVQSLPVWRMCVDHVHHTTKIMVRKLASVEIYYVKSTA